MLMLKLGAAKKDAGRAWFLVEVDVPHTDEELAAHGFTYRLRRKKGYRRGATGSPDRARARTAQALR